MNSSTPRCANTLPLAVCILSALAGRDLHAQPKVDFTSQIRPIFEKSCAGCHGAKTQMGQLRLDSKSAAMAGGQSGKVLQPGRAADSILFQRVAGLGDQARMPMGGKLIAEQIELIKQWIEQGASWPDADGGGPMEAKRHWAFVSPQRPAIPAVSQIGWVTHPIDSFILARLDREKLLPSPEADRITLLRRLTLDLTGLPPTPEEIDAFARDKSANAYEKQVERLLGSPHYGERWARIWLDAARYADSNGYEKDNPRQVWFYRDWVIRAFNQDMPYDRFIVRQLAGDQLPNAGQDDLVATGFLRNSMVNEEGGIDPEQFRTEALFDRMEAIGKAILGITVQCAQCHNHKYDPLRQEEYYRMMAFINDSDEANIAVYTQQEQAKRAETFRRTLAIEDGLRRGAPDWKGKMAAWESSVRDSEPRWTVLDFPDEELALGGQKLIRMEDGSLLAQGNPGAKVNQVLTSTTKLETVTAVKLELLTDPNLPRNGPGRSARGTSALSEFSVEAAPAQSVDGHAAKPEPVKIAGATADINPPEDPLDSKTEGEGEGKAKAHPLTGPIAFAIDGKPETAWGIDAGPGRRNQPRKAVFPFAHPVSFPGGVALSLHLDQLHGGSAYYNHNLGRFRLSVTDAPAPKADPLPKSVRDIISIPREQRSTDQTQTVFRYWRTTVPEWRAANEQIEALWRDYPEGSSQLVLQHREKPRETHVFIRGEYHKPSKTVTPGTPRFLNPLPADAQLTRLSFAEWLVDRKAPTTARAFVNRIWQAYFGVGLVATSEDLGTQSEPPSHPELLDWLAVEFMERGWSIKALQRVIVMSATYRQASTVTPELYKRDPYNRLLARGSRFRVEAESVHDIALAASGLLSLKVGGPSVYPRVENASIKGKYWHTSEGADRYRRALYTFRYRSLPFPMLQTFDAPNGENSCVRRERSNTPLQALTILNEPAFVEAAQSLARKTLREGGKDDGQRLRYAFRRCVSRAPTGAEADELLSLLRKEEARFARGGGDAVKFAGSDSAQGATPARAAAWTAVARVLLNLDETITRE